MYPNYEKNQWCGAVLYKSSYEITSVRSRSLTWDNHFFNTFACCISFRLTVTVVTNRPIDLRVVLISMDFYHRQTGLQVIASWECQAKRTLNFTHKYPKDSPCGHPNNEKLAPTCEEIWARSNWTNVIASADKLRPNFIWPKICISYSRFYSIS